MSETILINSLPTRTWNRLGVNETALTWGESADLGTERITAAGQTVRLDHRRKRRIQRADRGHSGPGGADRHSV